MIQPCPVYLGTVYSRDQEPSVFKHHDHQPFVAAGLDDAVRYVHGLGTPERELLQPELLPLHGLELVLGTARLRRLRQLGIIRRARLKAHPCRVVSLALAAGNEQRPRAAAPWRGDRATTTRRWL